MDITLECDCGNPNCHARTDFRVGYIHIRHPDGREEERWDWFHVFSVSWEDGDKESRIVELMAPPREARCLMWFLVREYMPGISRLVRWWRCWPARWWWVAKAHLEDWQERRKSTEDPS